MYKIEYSETDTIPSEYQNVELVREDSNGTKTFSAVEHCVKCGGTGYITYYNHVENGVCFDCDGSGWHHLEFRVLTESYLAKLEERRAKKAEKDRQKRIKEQEILNTLIVNVNGVNGVSRITLNPTINKDMNMNKPSENHTDTTISISESAKYWELCSELAMKFDVPIESIILYENNVYFTTDVYAIIEVYCEKNNRKLKRIFLNLSEDDDTVDLEEFLVIVDEHDGVIPIQTLLG